MEKIILAILALLSLSVFIYSSTYSNNADLILNDTPVKLCFSPDGGCTEAITKEINNAKSEILIQAYSFTSAPIAKALLYAYKRGVKIEAILDKSQRKEKYTGTTFFANAAAGQVQ